MKELEALYPGVAKTVTFSMVKVVDYNKVTGKILRVVCYYDPEHVGLLYPGCLYVEMDKPTDETLYYVRDNNVVARPEQSLTVEGLVIKGARCGASVIIEGVSYLCDGSDVCLEFDCPGIYTVSVEDWPFLEWSAEVESVPQS